MKLQGGKKIASKSAGDKSVTKKPRAQTAKTSKPHVEYVRPDLPKASRLESLAMIHHVHGSKFKASKRSYFSTTRLKDIVEANWSLWHLAWSILWRAAVIVLLVRIVAALAVSYLL